MTIHPHHRGAASPLVGGNLAADGEERRHLSRQIRRLVLGARRGLLRRGRDACERAQGPSLHQDRHAGRVGGGGELFLQALRLPAEAARPLRARSEFRAAEGAAERSGELRARRPAGPFDLAHHVRLGHPRARQPQAHHVCLGRCADQLHHRGRISRQRQREVQALLAGRPACDRQGHRALPRGLLAGVPDVGRHRGAAPHLLARLPVQPRRENVEVGRQRDRSFHDDRRLRRRSVPLFLPARGAVRPGRQLQPRGDRQPHQRRPRQRPRQSGAALADHDQQAVGRRAAQARRVQRQPTRPSWRRPTT